MVRLMLTLTPVVVILSSIAFSTTFDKYLFYDEDEEESEASDNSKKEIVSPSKKKDKSKHKEVV